MKKLILLALVAAMLVAALSACAASVGGTPLTTDRSEEHTSELQSPVPISYAVFCLKKKKLLRC